MESILDSPVTLVDAVSLYLNSLKKKKEGYQQHQLMRFAQWAGGNRLLTDLKPSDIDQFGQDTIHDALFFHRHCLGRFGAGPAQDLVTEQCIHRRGNLLCIQKTCLIIWIRLLNWVTYLRHHLLGLKIRGNRTLLP